jgi:hypothetical protein
MCNLQLSKPLILRKSVAIVILSVSTSLATTFNGFNTSNGFLEVELTTDNTAVAITDEAVLPKAFYSFRRADELSRTTLRTLNRGVDCRGKLRRFEGRSTH